MEPTPGPRESAPDDHPVCLPRRGRDRRRKKISLALVVRGSRHRLCSQGREKPRRLSRPRPRVEQRIHMQLPRATVPEPQDAMPGPSAKKTRGLKRQRLRLGSLTCSMAGLVEGGQGNANGKTAAALRFQLHRRLSVFSVSKKNIQFSHAQTTGAEISMPGKTGCARR